MADYLNMDNVRFFLGELEPLEEILEYERYADYDTESVDILIDSMKAWADNSFYPFFREMDEKPARFEDGKVLAHSQVARTMKEAAEHGYLGACFNYDNMGSQMPRIVFAACSHILQCANNHLPGYLNLTGGAANLIIAFGNKEVYDRFVPSMLSGDWGGTMALTEPQAGSSLSDITTTAYPQNDGYYKVKGQKIFISGGDYEGAENFVHLTLARIKGAPKGTKGISLFAIPKYRKDDEGRLISNDVKTAGDFQKLGQRGYTTVHLVFGENDDCRAYLIGKENMGLKYMFQMMNGARIDVGLTAASTATAAYYASLQYARERAQGRLIREDGRKDVDEDPTLIIKHPDVRRMLMFQKSVIEGSLALIFYCSALEDKIINAEDKERNHLLLEILTPVAKTFPSERGKDAVDNGLQVLGGYGFCMDFPLQQYYRDIRIMPIYEGTTGIQSLDLLGRKIPMENGAALTALREEISDSIARAKECAQLKDLAIQLELAMVDLGKVIKHLMPLAAKGEFNRYLSDATVFMDMFSTIVIGWQWLRMGLVVNSILHGDQEGRFSSLFYEGKWQALRFYYKYELKRVCSLRDILLSDEYLTVGPDADRFIN